MRVKTYLQRISHETRSLLEALAEKNGRSVPKELERIVREVAKAEGVKVRRK